MPRNSRSPRREPAGGGERADAPPKREERRRGTSQPKEGRTPRPEKETERLERHETEREGDEGDERRAKRRETSVAKEGCGEGGTNRAEGKTELAEYSRTTRSSRTFPTFQYGFDSEPLRRVSQATRYGNATHHGKSRDHVVHMTARSGTEWARRPAGLLGVMGNVREHSTGCSRFENFPLNVPGIMRVRRCYTALPSHLQLRLPTSTVAARLATLVGNPRISGTFLLLPQK